MSAWGQYGPCLVLCRLTVTTCCPWVSVGGVGTETNRNRLMTLWLIAQSVACYGGAYFTTETVKTAKPCHLLLQNVWRNSKQANKQTSKTNQSSSCTHMFASCLCTVMVRFGSFLSIHSTAATGDSFQVLPQRSHVSHWWSAPQKLKATAETTESWAPKHLWFSKIFQDLVHGFSEIFLRLWAGLGNGQIAAHCSAWTWQDVQANPGIDMLSLLPLLGPYLVQVTNVGKKAITKI